MAIQGISIPVAGLMAGFLSVCLLPSSSSAQAGTLPARVEQDIERVFDEAGSELNGLPVEDVVEAIRDLAANPVNINRASVNELVQIPALTLRLARAVVDYRQNEQPFEHIDQLVEVRGIGPVTLRRIQPYVTTGSSAELRMDLLTNPRFWTANGRFEAFSRFQRTVQQREGYRRTGSGGFAGSPVRYYQRFRLRSDHLSLNLTQEKDPGESLSGPAGFDYTSWHIAAEDLPGIKQLVIGDFSIRTGQGLILWNGTTFSKGRETVNSIGKHDPGIRPYTSAQETHSFRGIALTHGEKVQITGFFSGRRRSASVVEGDSIRFPADTGLHRTEHEIDRRFNTNQITIGGRARIEVPTGFAGITAYYNYFDRPVYRGTQPYQKHDFHGQRISALSLDYRLLQGPFYLSGEIGRTQNGGFGLLTGLTVDLPANTELAILYRNYGKRFQSIFGSAFGEQSGGPQNERGFYFGLKQDITETLQISSYVDHFSFPAPRYLTHQPTSGHDWLGLIEYRPDRQTELYFQIRQKIRGEEYSSVDEFGQTVRLPDETRRLNARFHLGYQATPEIRFRGRIEWVRARPVNGSRETGYLLYTDFRFTPDNSLAVDLRLTHFDTGGFDSRVYQFENDLLYVLSNSMLFNRGQRIYLLFSWQPDDWIRLWLKASMTIYNNLDTIGSGLNEIDGNKRNDVGFQVQIRV